MELTYPQQLHDRATRGQGLTAAERSELDAWYAQQDAQETALLTAHDAPDNKVVAALREQVNTSLAELHAVTAHIQTLTRENQDIRGEIDALYQRLTPTKTASAA